MVTAKEEQRVEKGWKIATLALLVTTALQTAGWIYWFAGWKSITDRTLELHDMRLTKVERTVEDLPRTLQRMAIQQRLMVEGMNMIILKEGGSPVSIIPDEGRQSHTYD